MHHAHQFLSYHFYSEVKQGHLLLLTAHLAKSCHHFYTKQIFGCANIGGEITTN